MKRRIRSLARQTLRFATSWLPSRQRYALMRNAVRVEEPPPDNLVFKLAETEDELTACFKLLHDAYVGAGFMAPDPSGMRVTLYHALPSTTTLLAKCDDQVVGTISLIRESALGFPLQRIFDIDAIRAEGGNIAEVSALAVHRRWRNKGGQVLFPLMKFMREYAVKYFDTRHLVIAVNPRHIPMYEGLLCFRRLKQNPVAHYDFVNGAPAVGAHLDLKKMPDLYRRAYRNKPPGKSLYHYFLELTLKHFQFPDKRFFTTNDPVMTPALINHFFNRETDAFRRATERERVLLHAIYDLPAYKAYLPPLPGNTQHTELRHRQHQRFSVMCPAEFKVMLPGSAKPISYPMKVIECSRTGFRATCDSEIPLTTEGTAYIELGESDRCVLKVFVLRHGRVSKTILMFKLKEPDEVWLKFVRALRMARTHDELGDATRFLASTSSGTTQAPVRAA
ncbi:hypothetical protein OPU71_02275 [Niveibacterium sp. 24ML]|uniref:N-acyl amino acid synthase FeeM domain-containing protein n=1 Tax=Niveibacterium sp. 24ML TaxID=2985512 RepID=UPI002270A04B|nr:hypothetical protein [Niveibacterium sp. 24ML]MCX9154946.1 hypothetical protein [Niveibacterium sp. 24ML]